MCLGGKAGCYHKSTKVSMVHKCTSSTVPHLPSDVSNFPGSSTFSQEVGKREILEGVLKSCVSEKQLIDCTGLQRQRQWRWWVWLRRHAAFPGILPQRRHSTKLGKSKRDQQKWFLSRKNVPGGSCWRTLGLTRHSLKIIIKFLFIYFVCACA